MLLFLLGCIADRPDKDVQVVGGGDTARPDSASPVVGPSVVFLDPSAGELIAPDQDVRVEILTGDDLALDTLALTWTGTIDGAALPGAPDTGGKASFELDPLPLGDYTIGVQVVDADANTASAEVSFSVVVLDADGDGFVNSALRGDDCDDNNAAVNPDAVEVCDTVDNDCDDRVDEGVTDPYYADTDGDGFGDPAAETDACAPTDTLVADATDCDDTDATAFPDAPETCDEVDDDCDGVVDDGVQTPYYRDTDSDTYGLDADVLWACSAPSGYVPTPGDCDDSEPAVSPAASEVCHDGLDNDCDGTSNTCALGGTVDLGIADAKLRGAGAGDAAGSSVSTAGDFDGDGLADVLVGAPGADGSGVDSGGAYVFFGPVLGTLATSSADVTLLGDTAGDGAGYAVAPAGDFDGDGFDDVLVGAWSNDAGGTDAGAAYLVQGPTASSLGLGAADLVLVGETAGDQAGLAVAAAGDVDGDGQGDVLVGAWGADAGGSYSGAAYLVNGPRSGTVDLGSADATLIGEAGGDFAGQAVAGVGDMDADGYDDVLIGAPGTASGTGTAYLLLGPLSGDVSLSSAAATFTGEVEDDNAGASVASAGDVDGDGNRDIIIGAYGYDYGGSATGAGFVLLGPLSGSTGLASSDALLVGEHTDDNAGWSVAGAGDMDGDGQDDVLVGALREDSGGSAAGAAYLVYGPIVSLFDLGSADARMLGEAPDDYAGAAVAPAGDTDGDGKGDILVGAPYEDAGVGSQAGAAYLVLGTGL